MRRRVIRTSRGTPGSRCAASPRRAPSAPRGRPARRRGCGGRARAGRPPAGTAPSSPARAARCRARSSPRACGTSRGDPARSARPPRRGTRTPLRSARRHRDDRARSRRVPDQVEQLVFHLRGHPPEHRVLDAAVLAVEVAARLRETTDRPLDVAEDLPHAQLVERQVAAGEVVVALEIRLHVADAAEVPVVRAEAPRAHERPRHVFDRIADVRELPVEHRDELVGHRHVAETEVAVHEGRLPLRAQPIAHPREPVLDRRMRLADGVELVVEALDRAAVRQEGQRLDRVDLRQLLGQLERQARRRIADEPAPDRLALDPLHGERLAAADLAEVHDGPRRADAGGDGRLEHVELLLERERVAMDHADARAPHEQRPPVREVDGPRLLRRAACELTEREDLRAEALGELVLQADWPPSTTSVWPVTYADARDDRKTTAPLRSSGPPNRPSGMRCASSGFDSITKFAMSLGNQPGAIALTLIPCRAHFHARSRVRAMTPPFVAWYGSALTVSAGAP